MEEDYEWLGEFYDEWDEPQHLRENEVDKRLQFADGYIDPRSYDTYDNSHLSWLKLREQMDEQDNMESEQWEAMSFYHPTVGNIDYKAMEDLPYHERIWERDSRKIYKYRYPYKLQKAQKIFLGSVGKNMSDIKKRVEPLLKAGRESFKHYTGWWLNPDVRTWSRRHIPDYFVDEENILRNRKKKASRPRPKLYDKAYYLLQQSKRKEKRERRNTREQEELILLQVINNRDLLDYVLKTKREYYSLKKFIEDAEYQYDRRLFPKPKFSLVNYDYKEAQKKKRILHIYKARWDKILSGDFSHGIWSDLKRTEKYHRINGFRLKKPEIFFKNYTQEK